ncbi:hypothetical protein BKI52_04430 [marine bacterium AO1-C]|nr:hypothetical protein BKI52_04430 [marine bacterium AO1-C]
MKKLLSTAALASIAIFYACNPQEKASTIKATASPALNAAVEQNQALVTVKIRAVDNKGQRISQEQKFSPYAYSETLGFVYPKKGANAAGIVELTLKPGTYLFNAYDGQLSGLSPQRFEVKPNQENLVTLRYEAE